MNINQAKQLIEQKGSEIPFALLKLIKIPEADILHCVYQSQKVNLKFDLVYDFEIEWIDKPPNQNLSAEILEFLKLNVSKKA